ncbi:hypothetical protein ACFW16_14095 [Inquilinus sp. NPDC058860]|uniref:hypothetical protein n=1 Tax=Inquilinus sp. NPDC058860 TaxID=3346652 RepID=UPI0036B4C758
MTTRRFGIVLSCKIIADPVRSDFLIISDDRQAVNRGLKIFYSFIISDLQEISRSAFQSWHALRLLSGATEG